jgi:hypothetical protein
MLLSVIHKLSNSVWNKKELLDEWKESIIVPIHNKSLLLTSYKILSDILSRLSSYIDEIIGDHQCGF